MSQTRVFSSRTARSLGLFVFTLVFASGCALGKSPKSPKTPQSPKPPESEDLSTPDEFELVTVPKTTDPIATFVHDGKPYCFAGANNYYVTYNSNAMVDDVMDRAVEMGLDVFRIWGFIDRGSLDESIPSVDDKWEEKGSKNGHYFQYWDLENNRVGVNEGKMGLQKLDYVLHAARKRNLKLIVVLTNNWQDFGGMDQYVTWFGKNHHHEFYTDETIREAYRNWVRTLVNRKNSVDGTLYRDDPAILAWELANEPKCKNHQEMDAQEGWDTTTIVKWADEMSRYIKSIDPNHMVAVGDEGWLNTGGDHWTRSGNDGVDHEALCAVENIDFCTFHLYPDDWDTGDEFGNEWIEEHIAVAKRLGKPTVLEEYNTRVQRDEKDLNNITWGWDRRKTALTNWTNIFQDLGGNGMLVWMLSGADDVHGMYPDYDQYGVYQDGPTGKLVQELASSFKDNAVACKLPPSYFKNVPVSKFVSVAKPQ